MGITIPVRRHLYIETGPRCVLRVHRTHRYLNQWHYLNQLWYCLLTHIICSTWPRRVYWSFRNIEIGQLSDVDSYFTDETFPQNLEFLMGPGLPAIHLCLKMVNLVVPRIPEMQDSHLSTSVDSTLVGTWIRLNIKTSSCGYGDSHVKDETVVRPSYL